MESERGETIDVCINDQLAIDGDLVLQQQKKTDRLWFPFIHKKKTLKRRI